MHIHAPLWIEINVRQLRENLSLLKKDMPRNLSWCSVVKDQAYGHGALVISKETLDAGASMLAVSNIDEAFELRSKFANANILIFGERPSSELEPCMKNHFQFFINDISQAQRANDIAQKLGKKISVQLELDTGMSRYGVRWSGGVDVAKAITHSSNLQLSGVMTHFAMSDELDKTFANQQLSRFQETMEQLKKEKLVSSSTKFHTCNTGGYLDLPHAHLDMVRIGILPLGVYPSQVCRRIPGIAPIMSVKTKIATLKTMEVGDVVGYGMHFKADKPTQIAVLPMGYGTGYPRLRNKGYVLIHGKKAPIVGGNAMNAIMVNVSAIPEAKVWDEVVLLGKSGSEEISIHDLAAWDATVSYEIMTRLNQKVRRVFVETNPH